MNEKHLYYLVCIYSFLQAVQSKIEKAWCPWNPVIAAVSHVLLCPFCFYILQDSKMMVLAASTAAADAQPGLGGKWMSGAAGASGVEL